MSLIPARVRLRLKSIKITHKCFSMMVLRVYLSYLSACLSFLQIYSNTLLFHILLSSRLKIALKVSSMKPLLES